MQGFSSMEEYLEHDAAMERLSREAAEEEYAERAAILNAF